MELNYQIFKNQSEAQQMASLVELEHVLVATEGKDAKNFLGQLFNDQEQNPYRRKKGLELTAQLSFLNKIRIEAVIDRILDVGDSDDHFILLSAIKLAHRFCPHSQDSIFKWLSDLTLHTDPEVRSESNYSIGRCMFYTALTAIDEVAFIARIVEAQQKFDRSSNEVENRVDAVLFRDICSFLLLVKSSQTKDIDSLFANIQTHLWQYARLSIANGETSVFINLINSLSIIRQLKLLEPNNWLEFTREFNEVIVLFQKLDAMLISNEVGLNKNYHLDISAIKQHVVEHILTSKFQRDVSRLNRLMHENFSAAPQSRKIINELIESINALDADKKKEDSVAIEIITKLHRCFPSIQPAKIKEDLESLDGLAPENIVQLMTKYFDDNSGYSKQVSTGYPQGDDILDYIDSKLFDLLPDYPLNNRIEFLLVLRDIINYFINALRGGKSRFGFLFKADAIETELQNSMLTFLQASERGGNYIPEVKEYSDGGRVDINYSSQILQVPIELKRTFNTVSWEAVLTDYIGQAQTYAYTRDQLAIFMVLDLSSNSAISPEANVKNLINILHLPPRQKIELNYPDYVVAFILPGNKMLPSDRSKY